MIDTVKKVCKSMEISVRSYSGRGMYGKKCIGFVVPRHYSSAQFAFDFACALAKEKDGPKVIEEFQNQTWCQDSLGLDMIVYVPSIAFSESDEDKNDDEEEEEEYDE